MKLTIDNSLLEEEFFTDARLLGVVAPVKDYRFCWLLNRHLGCDFRVNSDIEIRLAKKGRQYFFPVYEHAEPGNFLTHYIYNNQFEGEYLLPEFRHLDFVWLTKGEDVRSELLENLMQSIKSIPGVQLIMELEKEKIKNKIHLVF